MPRALVVSDSFKGTFTVAQVAAAISAGLEDEGVGAVRMPMADGGEGAIAALADGLALREVEALACNPWGFPCTGGYGLTARAGEALVVVEVAAVDGRGVPHEGSRDSVSARTRDTELGGLWDGTASVDVFRGTARPGILDSCYDNRARFDWLDRAIEILAGVRTPPKQAINIVVTPTMTRDGD